MPNEGKDRFASLFRILVSSHLAASRWNVRSPRSGAAIRSGACSFARAQWGARAPIGPARNLARLTHCLSRGVDGAGSPTLYGHESPFTCELVQQPPPVPVPV